MQLKISTKNPGMSLETIAVKSFCILIYFHRRHYYVEDTKFVELLSVFQRYLKRKRKEVDGTIARLQTGTERLDYMRKMVSELRSNLESTMPILAQTTEDVELLLGQLAEKRLEAKKSMELVSVKGSPLVLCLITLVADSRRRAISNGKGG
jgi:hypothetical protein